ncbi:FHA domain-containing protein [Synechococcus sp. PCC 7336]|uniref:FHA domain-containing protein n=1 Tax=Synechococcus sp. PCC 7336 TaxID=195250 RepID=UPI00034BB615|nr:FHA domain-containing protein [Synechococcus sp. PCC 7336]
MSGTIAITLSWTEPDTGLARQATCRAPIVLGRVASALPATLGDRSTHPIVLDYTNISRYHLLIDWQGDRLMAIDRNSRNGTYLNGQRIQQTQLSSGAVVQLGPYAIQVSYASAAGTAEVPPIAASTGQPRPLVRRLRSSRELLEDRQIDPAELAASGLPVAEIDFATVGGGLGSYIWADYLRIFGAAVDRIAALGMRGQAPYDNYKRLCLNSQIPLHERLRSNSDSCPDNIWGWPSYALREACHDLTHGSIATAARYLWQVFAEPTFVETYTPRAGNVFDSIDREANRIGWDRIWRYGRVKSIRQTTDGRYAIAYAQSEDRSDPAFLLARYVLVATGYPKIQFLPDLQTYRETYGDFKSVVNAYEDCSHVYQQLAQSGGTVLLRGRGIVASRIIQRLSEIRQQTGADVRVLHLMRSPKPKGNRYRWAQRSVAHHFEFQPFNWPKACWGGDLRDVLEQTDERTRDDLIKVWGGTTTADRRDWRELTERSLSQGWYSIRFATVTAVQPNPAGGTMTRVKEEAGEREIEADFIIDATGLDAEVKFNPMLADLVDRYQLPLNPRKRIAVANDFEITPLRQARGRIYAIGAIAFGGPYAAVDSFLGLQYACQRVLDNMVESGAPSITRLNGWGSLCQWLAWAANQAPDRRRISP